jgi:hypothetical protein
MSATGCQPWPVSPKPWKRKRGYNEGEKHSESEILTWTKTTVAVCLAIAGIVRHLRAIAAAAIEQNDQSDRAATMFAAPGIHLDVRRHLPMSPTNLVHVRIKHCARWHYTHVEKRN